MDNLRAQLHGDVISPECAALNNEDKALFDEISGAAPNFSPSPINRDASYTPPIVIGNITRDARQTGVDALGDS